MNKNDMKKIACADMGMDCPFVASGETAEAVMAALGAHGMDVHAEMMAGLDEAGKAAMQAKMGEVMKEV